MPLVFLILIIRKFKKIKFIQLHGYIIGHYLLNTEVMLCSKKSWLNTANHDTLTLYYHAPVDLNTYKNRFFLSRRYPICNKQLYKMWKRMIPIIPFHNVSFWINQHLCKILKDQYTSDQQRYYEGKLAYRDFHGVLEKEKISLYFTMEELNKGKILLNKMGISDNSRYVCLLVRDSEFYENKIFNLEGLVSKTSYRNANIENYEKAALYLAENGYYVVRMGSAVKKPFIINHPMIIDYATSNFRSDFMDIYIPAHCSFFMSTGSGLDCVAQVFRKPILLTNLVLSNLTIHYPVGIFIFKKILNKKTNKCISLKEALNLFNNNDYYNIIEPLKCYKLEIIENSEDEILEATKDMILLLQGKFIESEEYKILQEVLSTLLIKYNHYVTSTTYPPKCSRQFLLDNQWLLSDCK
jgi:putative glycosyltransferase (TIGR04372 family)